MWLWLFACTDGVGLDTANCDAAATAACLCPNPTISLGDGALSFTPLSPGQDVVMVHGPQGGWHVWASIYAQNIGQFVEINYMIDVLPELTRVSDNTYYVALAQWAECTGQIAEVFGYLDVSPLAEGELNTPPELLVGRELRLSVTVTDENDRAASSVIDVVGTPDPMDVGGQDSGQAQ